MNVRVMRRLCDAGAFAIPLALYALSASHEPGAWDTAELQGVPYILGIAHPTGFPLYVLLGYLWSHATAVGTIAFRMNLFSAVAIAGTVATGYALALRLGAWRPFALAVSLWYAVAPDVWSHGNRAEAQDLAVLCEALAIYACVGWLQTGAPRRYVAAIGLTGLGIAAHPNAIWVLPGLAFATIVGRTRPSFKVLLVSAAWFFAAIALYAYLPLRSAYVVAHGLDPSAVLSGVGSGIFWNYNNPSTLHGLWMSLTGSEFGTPHYLLDSLNPLRVPAAIRALAGDSIAQFGPLGLVLTLVGGGVLWRRDWRIAATTIACCTAGMAFSATYANESDSGRYRLMALWLAVVLIAPLVQSGQRTARTTALRFAATVVVLAMAGVSAWQQRGAFARPPGEGGRWVISAVAPYVPPGSVLVVDGWLDATSLAYGAYVDGSLHDRIVVSGRRPELLENYQQWAAQRPVFFLVDPHNVDYVSYARPFARLDAYHELYREAR